MTTDSGTPARHAWGSFCTGRGTTDPRALTPRAPCWPATIAPPARVWKLRRRSWNQGPWRSAASTARRKPLEELLDASVAFLRRRLAALVPLPGNAPGGSL